MKDPEVLKDLGNKSFMTQKFEEAIDFFTKALEINPKSHIYFANRANCFLSLGKYPECISDCKSCLDIEPSFTKAYFRMAKAHAYLDELENGI